MHTTNIRDTFLSFYTDRHHRLLSGTSLVPPPGDPVLFVSAGMQPLTDYLAGRPHPDGPRLVNVQRCLRTTDLEEVGDDRHLTFFSMLGSWSLDDYDGPQSLRWAHELLCEVFGVDPGRLHATVFGGDDQVGPDTVSARVWEELGVPVEPTKDDNWWAAGPTGPCGPDTEIFVWIGHGPPRGTPTTDERWMEVWNHVLMRYDRGDDGRLTPLRRPSVDTGMGLERLAMVLQGVRSVFDVDVFEPWTTAVDTAWGGLTQDSTRVVRDHLRSVVAIVGEGVRPAASGRGYVLRRLVRRTLTTLWRSDPDRSLTDLPDRPIRRTADDAGTSIDVEVVRAVLGDEEDRFRRLLERGRPLVARYLARGPLTEQVLHELHDTHGLPPELVRFLLPTG